MPVHAYTNWNKRESDHEEQVEPFRKYFFICEGANTETFYFKQLIDLRKELGIHPLIDIRLWEKRGRIRIFPTQRTLFHLHLSKRTLRTMTLILTEIKWLLSLMRIFLKKRFKGMMN